MLLFTLTTLTHTNNTPLNLTTWNTPKKLTQFTTKVQQKPVTITAGTISSTTGILLLTKTIRAAIDTKEQPGTEPAITLNIIISIGLIGAGYYLLKSNNNEPLKE